MSVGGGRFSKKRGGGGGGRRRSFWIIVSDSLISIIFNILVFRESKKQFKPFQTFHSG